jgi:uncharacterized membrane protein
MPDSSKPTRLLIFNAVAIIAACLVLFGYFAWIIATKYNPILALCSPLMLCVPLLIAAMQYRAVFLHSENAARHVGNYLYAAGGLLAIFFAMLTYIYVSNEKEIDYQRLANLIGITAACVYLLYCGRANQRWAKQLDANETNELL